jgi:hypothetical protein
MTRPRGVLGTGKKERLYPPGIMRRRNTPVFYGRLRIPACNGLPAVTKDFCLGSADLLVAVKNWEAIKALYSSPEALQSLRTKNRTVEGITTRVRVKHHYADDEANIIAWIVREYSGWISHTRLMTRWGIMDRNRGIKSNVARYKERVERLCTLGLGQVVSVPSAFGPAAKYFCVTGCSQPGKKVAMEMPPPKTAALAVTSEGKTITLEVTPKVRSFVRATASRLRLMADMRLYDKDAKVSAARGAWELLSDLAECLTGLHDLLPARQEEEKPS